jgi:hypothetical protein
VSKTKSVAFGDTYVWVYDVSLSLLLAELIRTVEERLPGDRPEWWSGIEHDLRVQAFISDFHLDLDLGLNAGQREELAALLEEATRRVQRRGRFTAEEASRWVLLDDHTVLFRGKDPIDTGMAADLGTALVALLRGQLAAPPVGTSWLLGAPGGQRTIGERDQT